MNNVERLRKARGFVVDSLETLLYACMCSEIQLMTDNWENGIKCNFRWKDDKVVSRGWSIHVPWEVVRLVNTNLWHDIYEILLNKLLEEIEPWSIKREGEN